MSDNNIQRITNQQTITSMEIAEITGKNHFDVMKAIRKMEPAWEKVRESKFALSYRNIEGQGDKQYPFYILTKTECLFVATKFNDEARAKLVLRWEQLEQERLQALQPVSQNDTPSNLPADPNQLTRKQLLLMALEAEEEKEKLQEKVEDLEADNYSLSVDNAEKSQQIDRLCERTRYLAVIMADTTAVTATQIAQDYGMGAMSFNKLLNGIGIQRKVGDQWILYSPFLGKGYVQTRMVPIHHADRPDTFKPVTVWTQLGRKFLYDRLKKHGTLPLVERTFPSVQKGAKE
jgi:phage regulator Rha-like protein